MMRTDINAAWDGCAAHAVAAVSGATARKAAARERLRAENEVT